MQRKQIFDDVSRLVDTNSTKIDVSETYRVLRTFVDYVQERIKAGEKLEDIWAILVDKSE